MLPAGPRSTIHTPEPALSKQKLRAPPSLGDSSQPPDRGASAGLRQLQFTALWLCGRPQARDRDFLPGFPTEDSFSHALCSLRRRPTPRVARCPFASSLTCIFLIKKKGGKNLLELTEPQRGGCDLPAGGQPQSDGSNSGDDHDRSEHSDRVHHSGSSAWACGRLHFPSSLAVGLGTVRQKPGQWNMGRSEVSSSWAWLQSLSRWPCPRGQGSRDPAHKGGGGGVFVTVA